MGDPPADLRSTESRGAPPSLRERGGFVVPLYRREALWLAFDGAWWKPNAVQVGVGGVNAISAEPWAAPLAADPQNYLVCPDRRGSTGSTPARASSATSSPSRSAAERRSKASSPAWSRSGGIQLRVYEPKPDRFPERPPDRDDTPLAGRAQASAQLGLGAGGKVRQEIYPDPHGIETWDQESAVSLFIQLLDSERYRALSGREPRRAR